MYKTHFTLYFLASVGFRDLSVRRCDSISQNRTKGLTSLSSILPPAAHAYLMIQINGSWKISGPPPLLHVQVFHTFLKIKAGVTRGWFPCLERCALPTMLCGGRRASSPQILPWCTCDWVTWPELPHGARVPWLMFYKLPRGSCTNSVPIFPPCCMHSAWDYIPQLRLLPQTMNSHGDDSHLTNPRTPRKIQIKEGRMHCADLSASCVCAGCRLVKERERKKKKERTAWILLPGGSGSMCNACMSSRL